MNNIAINSTVQTFTASRKTTTKATGSSDFGIALQSSFSYSEARGVNAIASNALEMLDDELEDMYVVSNAHKLQEIMGQAGKISTESYMDALTEINKVEEKLIVENICICVRVDEGGLPKLIEELQTGLANERSLRDVLQDHYDSYGDITQLNHGEYFYVDPETGSVEYAYTKDRNMYIPEESINVDVLTSLAIADDIATVLRYTYFKKEGDDSFKIQALISGISQRSAGYNTERFNTLWDDTVEHPREWYAMMMQTYKVDNVEDFDDMIDSLHELLDRHFKAEQKREAENDDFGSSSLTVAAIAAKIAVSKTNDTSTLAV